MGVQKGRHENTNKKKFFSKCAAAAFRAVSGKATALSYTELFSRKIKVLQAKVYKKTKEEHGFSSCYEQQTRTFVLPTYSLRSKYCDNTSKSKMFLLTTQQRALPAGYVPETKKFSKKKPKKLNQIMPLAAIKTRARITAAIGGSDFFADAEQKLDYAWSTQTNAYCKVTESGCDLFRYCCAEENKVKHASRLKYATNFQDKFRQFCISKFVASTSTAITVSTGAILTKKYWKVIYGINTRQMRALRRKYAVKQTQTVKSISWLKRFVLKFWYGDSL